MNIVSPNRSDIPSRSRRTLLKQTAVTVGLATVTGCITRHRQGSDDGVSVPMGNDGDDMPTEFSDTTYGGYAEHGRWRMNGHDAGRSSASQNSAAPRGDVGVPWLRRPGRDPHRATAPIVGPERVYVGYSESPDDGSTAAYVAGFDAEDGTPRLSVHLGAGQVVGLALAEDQIIVTTRGPEHDDSKLTALRREDGTINWTVTVPDVTGPPLLTDGTVFLATRDDDAVYAFRLDGTRRWRTAVDGECYTALCADGERVYVGLTDGRIVALELPTGAHQWDEQVVARDGCCPDIQGTPAVADGRLYVPGITEELAAVDATDGTVLWSTRVVDEDYGNPVPSPAVDGDDVYVSTAHGGVAALAANDGAIRWRDSEAGGLLPPALARNLLVVPRDGSVAAYNRDGQQVWTVEMTVPDIGRAGYIMDPQVALAHDRCYLGLADGRLYSIGRRD